MGRLQGGASRGGPVEAGLELPLALCAALCALFFFPALFGGESFFGRDVTPFFYPMKRYLVEAVTAGRFPLWNPFVAGGEPFFASLQPGVLYPGSLLLYLLPFPHSVDWLIAGHFLFAAAGWVLLLRREGHSAAAAALGAVAFVFGGYFVSLGNFINNLQTVSWAPWLFLAWGHYLARGQLVRLLPFIGVCVAAFLGGEPQQLGIVLLVVFARGLVRIVPTRLAVPRQIAGFAIAGFLALLVAGVQLAPFVEYVGESVRTLSVELSYSASRSQELPGLLHLFLPPVLDAGEHGFTTGYLAASGVPWLLSLYPGIVVAVFAGLGFTTLTRRERWFWSSMSVVGLVLALGSATPVYRLLFEGVPPLRAFRYPEKFALLFALALSWAGAAGVDHWRSRAAGRARLAWTALGLAAAYGLLALVLDSGSGPLTVLCGADPGLAFCDDLVPAGELYARTALRLAALLGCAGAVGLLVHRRSLSVRLAAWILVLVAAFDLLSAHRAVNPTVESDVYENRPWTAAVLDAEVDRRREYRFRGTPIAAPMGQVVRVRGAADLSNIYLDREAMGPNAGQSFGFLQQDGLQGVELMSVAMTHDAAIHGWAADPVHYLRTMNVRYYADATAAAASMPGLVEIARHPELPIRLFEVPDPLPRAFLADGHEFAEGPARALRRHLETPDSPRRVVLEAEMRLRTGMEEPPSRGDGRIMAVTWEAERIRLITRSPSPGTLVLLDRWYPGWKVTVNGEAGEILRANGVFRAVRVPAGQADVEFSYAPASLAIGGLSTALGLVACLGLLWWSRRRELAV